MTHDAFTYYGLALTFGALIFSCSLYVLGICIRLDRTHVHWYERYVLYSRFWLVVLIVTSVVSWFISDTYVWLVTTVASVVMWMDTRFARRYVTK